MQLVLQVFYIHLKYIAVFSDSKIFRLENLVKIFGYTWVFEVTLSHLRIYEIFLMDNCVLLILSSVCCW